MLFRTSSHSWVGLTGLLGLLGLGRQKSVEHLRMAAVGVKDRPASLA